MDTKKSITTMLGLDKLTDSKVTASFLLSFAEQALLLQNKSVLEDRAKTLDIIKRVKEAFDSSPQEAIKFLQTFNNKSRSNYSIQSDALFDVGVPSWSTQDDLLRSSFVITDDLLQPLKAKTVKHMKDMFYTQSSIQVILMPQNASFGRIELIDTSQAGSNRKTRATSLQYSLSENSSLSTWGILESVLDLFETESIRTLFEQLEQETKLSLEDDGIERCDVYHQQISSKHVFCPTQVKCMKRVTDKELNNAMASKRGPSNQFLYRLIANGQYHNFMLVGGSQFDEPVTRAMVNNPFFIGKHPSALDLISIDMVNGQYEVNFWFHSAKYSLQVDLGNRYFERKDLAKVQDFIPSFSF